MGAAITGAVVTLVTSGYHRTLPDGCGRVAEANVCGVLTRQVGCTNSVSIGVGNVYRAEVLFRHQMDPLAPGCELRADQWAALWSDLVELMNDGVRRARIDTVRPEHDPVRMGLVGFVK